MENINLKKEDLKQFITSLEYLKHGGNGIIYKYNETEILKLFYYSYFKNYDSITIDKVIEDIIAKTETENITKILFPNYINSKRKLYNLVTRLNNTSSNDLFRGLVLTDNHVIGTILNHYQNYFSYQELYKKFSFEENVYIMNKLIKLIEELLANGIYPTDLKLENVMINKDTLDVKLIDLDDNTTMLTDIRSDYYMYQVAKRTANIRKKIIKG